MWRFKSSMDTASPVTSGVGRKVWLSSPELGPPGLMKGLETTRGSRIIYPFSLNWHSLMMVPVRGGTETKVSGILWVMSPRGCPLPLWLLICSLHPSNSDV